jgi:hypothetical protein
MARFRSKPVEIEAVQFTPEVIKVIVLDGVDIPNGLQCIAASFHQRHREVHSASFICQTRQGPVRPDVNDWIIQESDGSGCYPCKPDVFAAKYEAID